MDRSDPLKLGCDEFTTIVGEEMGGGKKVAHRRDRLHCGIYAHAAWYQGPRDIHILIVYPADIANCITFYFFQIKI